MVVTCVGKKEPPVHDMEKTGMTQIATGASQVVIVVSNIQLWRRNASTLNWTSKC